MQVESFDTLEGRDDLRDRWNALVLETERPEVFLTYEWALAVERAFSRGVRPLVFAFREDTRLVGVAALATDPLRPRRVWFLGADTADYCDIVTAPGLSRQVTGALLRELRRRGVTDIELVNLPVDSDTHESLRAAGASGYRLSSRPLHECARIVLGNSNQRAQLKESVKHKRIARMRKEGPVEVVHVAATEQALAIVPRIVRAQLSRFLFDGRLSPLLEPERRQYLSELTSLLGPAGWLHITELRVGGEGLAWHFGFRFQRKLSHYLPTFEVEKASLSPGAVLLRLMIQEECDSNELDMIDFGLGDETYKSWFANASRQTRLVRLSTSAATHAGHETVRHAVAILERWPRLDSRLRTGRAAWAGVRRRLRDRGALSLARAVVRRVARPFTPTAMALYAWTDGPDVELPTGWSIAPVTWELLARAALQNERDDETLQYLRRAAARLRSADEIGLRGFALVSDQDLILHLCWTAPYGGFTIGELDYHLDTPPDAAAMVYDCWTPALRRGHEHYGITISAVARDLARQNVQAWISSSVQNAASIRGIEKTRFAYRHTLVRPHGFSRRVHQHTRDR
jgi:CelD/BcsL family acetyltransferase involved in cellulose biosynthesis